MGSHYRSDTRGGSLGFLKSMWTSFRWCQWVEPCADAEGEGKGVLFYRNTNGNGVAPKKMAPPTAKPVASKKAKMVVGPESDNE